VQQVAAPQVLRAELPERPAVRRVELQAPQGVPMVLPEPRPTRQVEQPVAAVPQVALQVLLAELPERLVVRRVRRVELLAPRAVPTVLPGPRPTQQVEQQPAAGLPVPQAAVQPAGPRVLLVVQPAAADQQSTLR